LDELFDGLVGTFPGACQETFGTLNCDEFSFVIKVYSSLIAVGIYFYHFPGADSNIDCTVKDA